MNQKGVVGIILLILVLVLGVGVGTYYYLGRADNKTQPNRHINIPVTSSTQPTSTPILNSVITPSSRPIVEIQPTIDNFFLEDTGDLLDNLEINFETVGKTFFSSHEDNYDFIHVFTANYPYIKTNNIYIPVRNNPSKGLGEIDDSNLDPTMYGAQKAGRLMGLTYIGINLESDFTQDPEEVYRVLLEEIGHNWGVYLGNELGGPSQSGDLILREQGPHWYKGLQSLRDYEGIREARPWVDNGDGTFSVSCLQAERKYSYSPITLYLMGLADSEEIKQKFLLIKSPELESNSSLNSLCTPLSNKITIKGTAVEVTIEDIIKAAGKRRTITTANSQKDFSMAFIIIYPKGTTFSDRAKKNLDFFSKDFPVKWAKATSCRSTLNSVKIPTDLCKQTVFPKN